MDGVEAGPDLAARRMVMAAIIYYELHENVMSDHQYDDLAAFVRDNFDHISPTLQFCIGREWCGENDGLEITGWTSSGFNFKYTERMYRGAVSWMHHLGMWREAAPAFKADDIDLETGIVYANMRS